MLRFIALRGVRAHENVEHSQHKENVIYRDQSRIEELLLQLENKQQIIQNNVETQHNRMFSLYIGSLCNVAFPMALPASWYFVTFYQIYDTYALINLENIYFKNVLIYCSCWCIKWNLNDWKKILHFAWSRNLASVNLFCMEGNRVQKSKLVTL